MRKSTIIPIIAALIGAAAVIVAALISRCNKLSALPPQQEVQITSPADGADVVAPCAIEGTTTYLGMKHYILSKPQGVGTIYIEDGPLQVSEAGEWKGIVRLGSAGVGANQKYDIRVIVTRATLQPGGDPTLPAAGTFSRTITIKRTN